MDCQQFVVPVCVPDSWRLLWSGCCAWLPACLPWSVGKLPGAPAPRATGCLRRRLALERLQAASDMLAASSLPASQPACVQFQCHVRDSAALVLASAAAARGGRRLSAAGSYSLSCQPACLPAVATWTGICSPGQLAGALLLPCSPPSSALPLSVLRHRTLPLFAAASHAGTAVHCCCALCVLEPLAACELPAASLLCVIASTHDLSSLRPFQPRHIALFPCRLR